MESKDAAEKSPTELANELKTMLVSYAKQETTEPLKRLGTWVVWGVVGAVLLFLAALFLSLGLLRMFQTEVGATDRFSWLPYLGTAVVLGVGIGLAGWGAKRTFDDPDKR